MKNQTLESPSEIYDTVRRGLSKDNDWIALQIDEFLKFVNKQAKYYRTHEVILTMGGDFTYQYAEMYFKNMDKLIRYIIYTSSCSLY